MKRIILPMVMMGFFAWASNAQALVDWRDYYTWEAILTFDDGKERPTLKIGASKRATDGFDLLYEKPGQYSGSEGGTSALRSYFLFTGGTGKYWSDIRSDTFPQSWTVYVETRYTARDVNISWDTRHVAAPECSEIVLTLADSAGPMVTITDPANTSYIYTGGAGEIHTFNVTANLVEAASGPVPTGLSSKPSQGVPFLSWDADTTAAGYKLYRDGVLISGEALITDADGDGSISYLDISIRAIPFTPGSATATTYTYAVTSMGHGEGACESEAATVDVDVQRAR